MWTLVCFKYHMAWERDGHTYEVWPPRRVAWVHEEKMTPEIRAAIRAAEEAEPGAALTLEAMLTPFMTHPSTLHQLYEPWVGDFTLINVIES
jgi:hypothetical protein